MLKRLCFVLSLLWAVLLLWNGTTRPGGIQGDDLVIAFAPLVLYPIVGRIAGFVVHGR